MTEEMDMEEEFVFLSEKVIRGSAEWTLKMTRKYGLSGSKYFLKIAMNFDMCFILIPRNKEVQYHCTLGDTLICWSHDVLMTATSENKVAILAEVLNCSYSKKSESKKHKKK